MSYQAFSRPVKSTISVEVYRVQIPYSKDEKIRKKEKKKNLRNMKPVGSKHQLPHICIPGYFLIPFNPHSVSTRLVMLFSFHRWDN